MATPLHELPREPTINTTCRAVVTAINRGWREMSMGGNVSGALDGFRDGGFMAQVAEETRRMTIAEYDAFVAGIADDREFELVDGELVMMANPTETHEQIAANIGAPLKLAMDRRGCRTYQGGMRVQRDDDSSAHDKYRPDVLVRCGARANKTYVTDPVVIIEVLSPSTIDNDRGRKLRFYKRMPTAMHIVLAYSDQMRIEHFWRTPDGWQLGVLTAPAETLSLEAVDFSIDLSRIYFDLPF
jgi:Uma2 family endonuclease